jgi:hypothetical protein
MEGRKIIIKIDPIGTPTVEAVGFNGSDCAAATEGIERALGGAGDRTLKPEYYNEGRQPSGEPR